MPVARKRCVETRISEIFRGRGACAHAPARFGSTRIGLRAQPQKHGTHACARRRQCQPPRGGEVERFVLAIDFEHHRAQPLARKRIARRLERILGMIDAQQNKPCRIEPHFHEAAAIDLAMFERGKILPDPQKRAVAAKPLRQPKRKAASRRIMPRPARMDFVQRLAPQAAQHRIRARMAKRNRGPPGLERRQRLAQRGQKMCGRGHFFLFVPVMF